MRTTPEDEDEEDARTASGSSVFEQENREKSDRSRGEREKRLEKKWCGVTQATVLLLTGEGYKYTFVMHI